MSTFYIQQFGCRATQADGAAIERQLLDRGFTPASDAAAAGTIVINTCTVTAAADSQARDAIRKIHAQNPAARVIVTGCYAQRAPEELAALPGVSFVVGNSHKPQIPHLIDSISPHRDSNPTANRNFVPATTLASTSSAPQLRKILTGNIFDHTELLTAPVLGGEGHHTRPTLKIQDGCNLRCSYCVIPFVRGKSRSLPPDTVISEIQRLSDSSFREIVLSGINLGTYGRDLSPRVEFEHLLRTILNETSVQRLRISSIEPLDVTQDLIELFASSDRIAQHFHMPLQSASDRILAAMHRWYRAEHYARRVELINDRLPHAAIGADVITGFPGETEADHAATLSFIERLPFTYLHVFSFSQRPGTKAAALPNQVPAPIIKRRARELRALSEAKSAAFRRSQLGRTLRVLTLRRADTDSGSSAVPLTTDSQSGRTLALSSNYLRVRIPAIFPANIFLDVLLSGETGNHSVGEPAQALSESSAHSASLR
ncbi:MAG: tRNA (N(6)-L-threonylcarbamoyladenosine(37)-C(2))-methylthiotransferase MtaB [Candidatus Acidiferrum sp.]